MEKVKGSRELLEELINLPVEHTALVKFAREIGACSMVASGRGQAEHGELFHNCLDIINLRQQMEQSNVLSKQSEALSKQTVWIERYTIATFALVVVTALIAILR